MPNLTLSAHKNEREDMESVLELSNFTAKIAGSEVPVIDPSKVPFLHKIEKACPAWLSYNNPVLRLSRFEFSEVKVGEAARESGKEQAARAAAPAAAAHPAAATASWTRSCCSSWRRSCGRSTCSRTCRSRRCRLRNRARARQRWRAAWCW